MYNVCAWYRTRFMLRRSCAACRTCLRRSNICWRWCYRCWSILSSEYIHKRYQQAVFCACIEKRVFFSVNRSLHAYNTIMCEYVCGQWRSHVRYGCDEFRHKLEYECSTHRWQLSPAGWPIAQVAPRIVGIRIDWHPIAVPIQLRTQARQNVHISWLRTQARIRIPPTDLPHARILGHHRRWFSIPDGDDALLSWRRLKQCSWPAERRWTRWWSSLPSTVFSGNCRGYYVMAMWFDDRNETARNNERSTREIRIRSESVRCSDRNKHGTNWMSTRTKTKTRTIRHLHDVGNPKHTHTHTDKEYLDWTRSQRSGGDCGQPPSMEEVLVVRAPFRMITKRSRSIVQDCMLDDKYKRTHTKHAHTNTHTHACTKLECVCELGFSWRSR